ncbi:MAG: class I SAM-dependent methyltransferase [Desulfatibacillaceae bacterium]|nr:class I SAM-dependent methyltransferase [Desulfatibacillaceae bacterium]
MASYVKGKRVLELGCGTGNATRSLITHGAAEIICIDKDSYFIQRANNHLDKSGCSGQISFVEMNLETNQKDLNPFFRFHQVDTVFSFNFLEHLQNDIALLSNIYSALPDKGILISIIPAGNKLFGRMDEAYNHFRRYDACDIKLRFAPFKLLEQKRLGQIKALGWMLAGRRPYQGLEEALKIYKWAFTVDCFLDRLFKDKIPVGASWVCVHQKDEKRTASVCSPES